MKPPTFLVYFNENSVASTDFRRMMWDEYAAAGAKHVILTDPVIRLIAGNASLAPVVRDEIAAAGLELLDAHAPFGKWENLSLAASQPVAERLRNWEYPAVPEIIRDEKAKTTTYRIKLAFDDLAPLKPVPGKVFGFSMLIFDKDTPTSSYHMDYSPGVCNPFDPSQYPAFRFE